MSFHAVVLAEGGTRKIKRQYAKGIGGGSRRRVTCGWYAKNLLRVYARMWVSAVYFSVGKAWKARRRERTLSA